MRTTEEEGKSGVDDGFAYVCAICQEFGELLCCEQCAQGFHLACLNLQSVPETDAWLCEDCSQNKVRCFECKEYAFLDESVIQCSRKSCSKFYHERCLTRWRKRRRRKSSSKKHAIVCPQHVCDACGGTENFGNWKLFRCLHCPVAYHENCCPDRTSLLEDIPGYLLCWRHEDENNWNYKSRDLEWIDDVKNFFQGLPVPEYSCDFDIPCSFHDYVKRLNKKPPQYVHIRRNIYLVKRPKRRPEDECMQCTCKPALGSNESCGKDCLCGLLLTSCSASCGCGDSCRNLPFQKRVGRKLQVVKTQACGWGLEAAEDIKAGDFLIEYVGEVIDDRECEVRLWAMKERFESNFYMCEINREMVIDATFKGNLSRFINHSCCPNTELQKWQIDGEIRIGVFAISDIKKGETVSYDYQFVQFGTDQKCYCGASACRGKLGAKPSKQKLCSDAAMQIVTNEVLLSRQIKKSKPSGGFSIECGFNCIDRIFRQRKVSSHAINKIEGIQDPLQNQKTPSTCVGLRIRVWWPLDQKFYSGKIVGFDPGEGTHQIDYDDGEKETLFMDKETWELEGPVPLQRRHPLDQQVSLLGEERLLLMQRHETSSQLVTA
eukprot:c27003_g1_i1 orf=507-2315(+)